MIIMHIQLTGPYSEGFSYQENIIPKYHRKAGNEVVFIGTCYSWDRGKLVKVSPIIKRLSDGVLLERVPFFNFGNEFVTEKLRLAPTLYERICYYHPDFIMLHDVQSLSNYAIKKYLKMNPHVRLVIDCHTDYCNSATNWISKNIIHKILWKHMAKLLEPYTEKYYGVLPARVDFLRDVYHIKKNKCELLVMGSDDELIATAQATNARNSIRNKYCIKESDMLIVTGGKIDKGKKEILLLMNAVSKLCNHNVKLIIFGSIEKEMECEFFQLIDKEQIMYAGWLSSEEIYRYFEAADIVAFPGSHSVLWEIAAGQGKPLLVRKWNGINHLDFSGNLIYIDDLDLIENILIKITDHDELTRMKNRAIEVSKNFLYSNISQKIIE